jgi:nicotinamide riboside kinase
MPLKFSLTGTHSSGKTTLVNALREKIGGTFNFYVERTKYLNSELGVALNDDSQLISQYIFLGERAKELFNPKDTISDRSVYDVLAYTMNAKSINSDEANDFLHSARHLIKRYDCIFYVSPEGIPIEDNGLRHTDPLYRDQIDQTIQDLLEGYKPNNLVIVSGTVEERVQKVIETIKQYL